MDNSKISISLWTYNRAHLVGRAVDSVINQTYQNFELILINNGSTDNTSEVLEKYKDHKNVRLFTLEENRGYQGGLSFGLSKITGDWYCHLSDDDTLFPEAFETMINVPQKIDPKIDAVTCNCIDSATGKFAGKGLDKDQYLDLEKITRYCSGEFFGITKVDLIKTIEVNMGIDTYDNSLWRKINEVAHRYYIHVPLKTFYTDHGGIRLADQNSIMDLASQAKKYKILAQDNGYWEAQLKFNQQKYIKNCLKGLMFAKMGGDSETAKKYKGMLNEANLNLKYRLLSAYADSMFSGLNKRLYNARAKSKTVRSLFGGILGNP